MHYVVCDLDHTLSDASWRDHLVEHIPDGKGKRPEDFYEYNALAKDDKPFLEIVWLLRSLKQDERSRVLIVTARPERNRPLTEQWLKDNEVPFDVLIMRPDGELCPSPMFKASAVIEHVKLYSPRWKEGVRHHVGFIIDDREDVCEAFRALGITALHVRHSERREF